MNATTNASIAATKKTVVVCGSLHLDVVVDADHLPRRDETVVGSRVSYICGGKGGNQAVAAALNGAHTVMIGCIGKDEFGNHLYQHLKKNNVDCSGLQTVNDASGMSVAIVDNNGDYGAVIVSGSNLQINCRSIEFPHSTGILLLQNEIPENANYACARRANELNIPVMLNAAPYRALSARLESLIDILILNRIEAEHFFDTQFASPSDVSSALMCTESLIDLIVVTLGEEGFVYRDKIGHVHTRSACSIEVSSTHGAGDMFCGTLASRIIAGDNTSKALEYASAAAAWYVSSPLSERLALDIKAISNLVTQEYF